MGGLLLLLLINIDWKGEMWVGSKFGCKSGVSEKCGCSGWDKNIKFSLEDM